MFGTEPDADFEIKFFSENKITRRMKILRASTRRNRFTQCATGVGHEPDDGRRNGQS